VNRGDSGAWQDTALLIAHDPCEGPGRHVLTGRGVDPPQQNEGNTHGCC